MRTRRSLFTFRAESYTTPVAIFVAACLALGLTAYCSPHRMSAGIIAGIWAVSMFIFGGSAYADIAMRRIDDYNIRAMQSAYVSVLALYAGLFSGITFTSMFNLMWGVFAGIMATLLALTILGVWQADVRQNKVDALRLVTEKGIPISPEEPVDVRLRRLTFMALGTVLVSSLAMAVTAFLHPLTGWADFLVAPASALAIGFAYAERIRQANRNGTGLATA